MADLLRSLNLAPHGLQSITTADSSATEPEPAEPPRFAQVVGLFFAVAGLVGYLTETPPVAFGATAAALPTAALGSRPGCDTYLINRPQLPAATR
ncbi:DUF4395 family protein [Sinosporangium album]|uniref:DUF4395 family protein n=1 Tax=Sinosporangium album TaxID=504805 RepID=UPI001C409793